MIVGVEVYAWILWNRREEEVQGKRGKEGSRVPTLDRKTSLICFGKAYIKGGSDGKTVTHRISWRISHVTSRGNAHKDVFNSHKDREQLLSYVASAGERFGAIVHTWCLMRNHAHLLLETPSGTLAQIMRHINGADTTSVNGTR